MTAAVGTGALATGALAQDRGSERSVDEPPLDSLAMSVAARVQALVETIETAERDKASLTERVDEAQGTIERLSTQLEDERERADEAQADLERERSERSALEKRAERIAMALTDAEARTTDLELELDETRRKLSELDALLRGATNLKPAATASSASDREEVQASLLVEPSAAPAQAASSNETARRLAALGAEPDGENTKIVVPGDGLFSFASADIQASGRTSLQEIAAVLGELEEASIMVVGHTDAVGDPGYNLYLSERRARSVKSFLVETAGLPHWRVKTRGAGAREPIATNKTGAGRRSNRRIEILVLDYEIDRQQLASTN